MTTAISSAALQAFVAEHELGAVAIPTVVGSRVIRTTDTDRFAEMFIATLAG